jgi:hypothetical protein
MRAATAILSLSLSFSPVAGFSRNHHFQRKTETIKLSFANSSDKASPEKEDLFQELDSAFEYDGRLPMKDTDFRTGFVSILGAPNMGKVSPIHPIHRTNIDKVSHMPCNKFQRVPCLMHC